METKSRYKLSILTAQNANLESVAERVAALLPDSNWVTDTADVLFPQYYDETTIEPAVKLAGGDAWSFVSLEPKSSHFPSLGERILSAILHL